MFHLYGGGKIIGVGRFLYKKAQWVEDNVRDKHNRFVNLHILLPFLAQAQALHLYTHSKVNRDVWAMDGGDADGVMEVDEQSESSDYPGEEDVNEVIAGHEEDLRGLISRMEDTASPLRSIISVPNRWPSTPCFGSVNYTMNCSTADNFYDNLQTRCPRLGFCFWTTQDRCDECGQPACRMHGYQHFEPDRDVVSVRVDRSTSPHTFYHFLCVHCRPVAEPIVVGATMAELRGWNEEFRFIDPISGTLAMANSGNFRRSREWENEVGENYRELAPDVMIDEDDEP